MLEAGISHPLDLEAYWNELCKKTEVDKGELEVFLGVSSSQYKAEIKGVGAPGMDEILAVHLNSSCGDKWKIWT